MGEGWSAGGQASPSLPGLETDIEVATQGYVQLGSSLPGEVRVAAGCCGYIFVFVFSLSFLFSVKV